MYVPCYSIKEYVWLQFVMVFVLKWNFLFLLSNAGGHGHNTVVVSFSCWGVKKSELVLSKFVFFWVGQYWPLPPGHWPIGLPVVMIQIFFYCHITVVVLTFLKIVKIIFICLTGH